MIAQRGRPGGIAQRQAGTNTTAPVVVRIDSAESALDVGRIHFAYLNRTGAGDPLEPRQWAKRNVTVLGVADVGGTAPPCDLLAAHGLSRRAAVFVRDRGRLVAYAVLMRGLDARRARVRRPRGGGGLHAAAMLTPSACEPQARCMGRARSSKGST